MTDVAALPKDNGLVRRICITLAALAIFRLAGWIPLAGVDPNVLIQQAGSLASDSVRSMTSVMALGVVPLLSAMLVSEAALCLSARLRRWASTPRGSLLLGRGVFIGAIALATIQSYGIAAAFEAIPGLIAWPDSVFRAGVTVSFIGATALVVCLARWITHSGVGSGFWVLLAAGHLDSFFEVFRIQLPLLSQGAVSPSAFLFGVALWLGSLGIVAAVFALLIKTAPRLSDPEELVWSPLLATLCVGAALSVMGLVQWVFVPAGTPDLATLISMKAMAPALALAVAVVVLLRRRSFLHQGQTLRIAPTVPVILAVPLLASGVLLIPNTASTLVLAAVGLMVLDNLGYLQPKRAADRLPP